MQGRPAFGGPRGGHHGGRHGRAGPILTPGYVPFYADAYQPVQQQVIVQPVVTQTQIVNQPYYVPVRINCTRPRIVEVKPERKSGRRAALPRVIYGTPYPCR